MYIVSFESQKFQDETLEKAAHHDGDEAKDGIGDGQMKEIYLGKHEAHEDEKAHDMSSCELQHADGDFIKFNPTIVHNRVEKILCKGHRHIRQEKYHFKRMPKVVRDIVCK